MEQGEALRLISLAVPWLEKMLSSQLIGGLLKGQEKLMVLLCPDFSVAQGLCICCQQRPAVGSSCLLWCQERGARFVTVLK